jgi:hypothetical protein
MSPEIGTRENGGDQEMNVDPADACADEIVTLDEGERFLMLGGLGLWKPPKQLENLGSPFQSSTRDLADHERMTDDLAADEKSDAFKSFCL